MFSFSPRTVELILVTLVGLLALVTVLVHIHNAWEALDAYNTLRTLPVSR